MTSATTTALISGIPPTPRRVKGRRFTNHGLGSLAAERSRQLGGGGRLRCAGGENAVHAGRGVCGLVEGDPQVRAVGEAQTLRRDAHHGSRLVSDLERPPHDPGIGAPGRPPDLGVQDHHRLGARRRVGGDQRTAQHGHDRHVIEGSRG